MGCREIKSSDWVGGDCVPVAEKNLQEKPSVPRQVAGYVKTKVIYRKSTVQSTKV